MSTTYQELCDKLKDLDEITLIEELELTAEQIVDRCGDLIEDNFDELLKLFEEELEEDIELE